MKYALAVFLGFFLYAVVDSVLTGGYVQGLRNELNECRAHNHCRDSQNYQECKKKFYLNNVGIIQ